MSEAFHSNCTAHNFTLPLKILIITSLGSSTGYKKLDLLLDLSVYSQSFICKLCSCILMPPGTIHVTVQYWCHANFIITIHFIITSSLLTEGCFACTTKAKNAQANNCKQGTISSVIKLLTVNKISRNSQTNKQPYCHNSHFC